MARLMYKEEILSKYRISNSSLAKYIRKNDFVFECLEKDGKKKLYDRKRVTNYFELKMNNNEINSCLATDVAPIKLPKDNCKLKNIKKDLIKLIYEQRNFLNKMEEILKK
tara:strand:- start:3813 stop:4142 length:330 start_codon:yes stop_codon:yes gene_type:complete